MWKARDYLVVYKDEQRVRALTPDMTKLAGLDAFAVIVLPEAPRSFRVALLRARAWSTGRPGNRLGALHADPVLVRRARQEVDGRASGVPRAAASCSVRIAATA